jgi:membrane protease YdiL (CAAX protease family)
MDLFWRALFAIAVGLLIWLLHGGIGAYPEPLPRSARPRRELGQALLLWVVALALRTALMPAISSWLGRLAPDRTAALLLEAALLSLLFLALPAFLMLRVNRWSARDLGLTWRTRSAGVAVYALCVGLGSGGIAYATGQSNISIEVLPATELLLLVYSNAFLEEFYYRGVIQSLLEQAAGQKVAIWLGGILFGLVHVAFDIRMLFEAGGAAIVFAAVLLQTMAGWLFGITYMKTRTLWPGIACHYLANWLPSILVAVLG